MTGIDVNRRPNQQHQRRYRVSGGAQAVCGEQIFYFPIIVTNFLNLEFKIEKIVGNFFLVKMLDLYPWKFWGL